MVLTDVVIKMKLRLIELSAVVYFIAFPCGRAGQFVTYFIFKF